VLTRQQTPNGVVYICPHCGGRAAALTVLRKAHATDSFCRALWIKACAADAPQSRPCPHCGMRMSQVTVPGTEGPLTLDVCRTDEAVWFDPSEFQDVPLQPAAPQPAQEDLPESVKEKLALLKLQSLKERSDDSPDAGPAESWQWLPAILGLPVECDGPPIMHRPWLTWGIACACVLATIPVLLNSAPAGSSAGPTQDWGFIPSEWMRQGGLTLITSFFLHGGVFHLLSNMYFFVVFGDHVEDNLGRMRYVLLLVAAHLAGLILHGALDPHSDMPLVGASAGISGVLAYYAIAFPNVRLGFLWRYYFWFRWIRIPAWSALVLFVLLQLGIAYLQVKGFSNVSALGHLGGLVVGVAAAVAVHLSRTRPREVEFTSKTP
jgi:membrane associated rhomboid family serine protease